MTQGFPLSQELRPALGKRSALFRQVSQEVLGDENLPRKCAHLDGRGSPARCVSDFDRLTAPSHAVDDLKDSDHVSVSSHRSLPEFRTPLSSVNFFQRHVAAVRLEAELHPFRLIISRLMSHTTLNKKGIFNVPVDPVALNLPDYLSVIKNPMDLGTIKARLHAAEYNSREAVVHDIRRVFTNAMTYNAPLNAVHIAAKQLLSFFEEQLEAFVPDYEETDTSCTETSNQNPSEASNSSNSNDSPDLKHSGIISIDSCKKRKKRGSKKNLAHACQWCEGRKCFICLQGCLSLEPCLLICNGPQCSGSRIRKGAIYYVAPDGSRQYCERCHTGLPSVLPNGANDNVCRYKRELLKRKNEEEIVEGWVSCRQCQSTAHKICAMFNEHAQDESKFICGQCVSSNQTSSSASSKKRVGFANNKLYSFVSGIKDPIPIDDLVGHGDRQNWFTAELLPECSVSCFIEEKVQEKLRSGNHPNADKTIAVRVISDCDKHFKIPEVVRNHFRVATGDSDEDSHQPPNNVCYRSKAIALFQKIDGFDVCIFCMYVQEYDSNIIFQQPTNTMKPSLDSKRVYIAYLDSVEHFRPRRLRTSVYHEILVAYLATAKARGFQSAHIWACPPSRGNSFVFWTYPGSQRTPTQERLTAWYHEALLLALRKGIVTDVKSLYETDFEPLSSEEDEEVKFDNVCPPLLDGDYWIEEAIRLHSANMARQLKSRSTDGRIIATPMDRIEMEDALCPALVTAAFIRDEIIADPVSFFFRKPVNAAALNLKDYHKIITRPMDLGTVYARCMMGEYPSLKDLVGDVELVVSNAKKFNPPGNIVHVKADELLEMFFSKLNETVKGWPADDGPPSAWTAFQDVSLRLDASFTPDTASSATVVSASVCSLDTGRDKVSVTDLLSGGVSAVEKRMVGQDTWLLEKKPAPSQLGGSQKKSAGRRRKNTSAGDGEPPSKRRRQTWLAEEVSSSIRKMRQSFFSCSLKSLDSTTSEQVNKFSEYIGTFNPEAELDSLMSSTLADARHSLLEFSQFRNLQFDTLRRAKYSTAVLLYHLHNGEAPGVIPCCTSCQKLMTDVRWHKLGKVTERRDRFTTTPSHKRSSEPAVFRPEELCPDCIASRTDQADFIPVQVSCNPQ